MILTTTFFATGLHSSKQQLMQLFSVTRVGAILCWLMLSCSHVASANASSDIQGIIDTSIAAYGADNLTKLRSLRLEDTLYQFSQGQSGYVLQGESIAYLNQQQTELTIDFSGDRTDFRQATNHLVGGHANAQPVLIHRLFSNNKGMAIDHALAEIRLSDSITRTNVALNYHYMLDTLLMRELAEHRNSAQWLDVAYIQGQAHDVLTFMPQTNTPVALYVNKQTGLISRAVRQRGQVTLSYDYQQHQNINGIRYANQVFVGANQQPLYHLSTRRLHINDVADHRFTIAQHYKAAVEKIPFNASKLSIRQIEPGVY